MRPAVAPRRASKLTASMPPSVRHPRTRVLSEPIAYHGVRTPRGDAVVIRRDGARVAPLDLRHDVEVVSCGFEWRYIGQGPLQLAVALLADACGPETARRLALAFCERVTSVLPRDEGWTLTRNDVRAHARALEGRS